MREEFVVTEEHIKLLRAAVVRWDDSESAGAPAIDSKRPYGNTSYLLDIAEILGESFEYPDLIRNNHLERYRRLHRETETVLQILLNNLEYMPLRVGQYARVNYGMWLYVGE